MGCSSCKKPGIVVVRQPTSAPKVDKKALLQPLAQKKKVLQPIVQDRKPAPAKKQMNLGTTPSNVCPLCKIRLQPVIQNISGRTIRVLKCNTAGCNYMRKI